ncbi:hypothetical protein R6V09_14950 [Streptomyces sp. W16]|uniref:hypothetical protein n=1 Tax=Streptomyces sp. W16 TaxID=3076631 RepID=UPI00295A6CBA|nr:hypothetical protein [Streptomyces sp. W16]MDV9171415.1 hypothetical protein [Streptomyces sp. W16]
MISRAVAADSSATDSPQTLEPIAPARRIPFGEALRTELWCTQIGNPVEKTKMDRAAVNRGRWTLRWHSPCAA